ncbi:caspase family protein [Bradyrhizobium sediminis]|uniref:Caspase family protein n=2 Tax=Bradyrhizobium sediminis TaxID=2840469 RepID=A0A975NKE9_9BRAD|nr:caspase family protein [Bradyrhizobium sediminis]
MRSGVEMQTFWKVCLLLLFACALGCSPASAERRVALVIGNGAYSHKARLTNPENDAADVAAALKRTNFEVILANNLGQLEMQDAAIRFSRAARNADVALFCYSGHAMQFNGVNYLMPIDAKLDDEADLKRFTRVDDIMNDLQQAKNLRILVLDSCRDNPFPEALKRSLGPTRGASVRQGLSKMDAPLGTIVSFSTQAGQTADDGTGRNSPYTAAFVRRIEEPKEIGEVFRDISADVYETSGRSQLPELSLSIIGKFYLNGPVSITVTPPAQSAPANLCSAAETHWKAADVIGTVTAYEDHVARFPTCAFSNLARARIDGLKQKAALAPPLPSDPKTGTGKFDGEWDVKILCPQTGNVGAYSKFMIAAVKDSTFHAEELTRGTPGWLAIDGKIGTDGKATLVAKGLTASPAATLGHAKAGSPYGYTVTAQFDGSSGAGKRNENRLCNLSFARR